MAFEPGQVLLRAWADQDSLQQLFRLRLRLAIASLLTVYLLLAPWPTIGAETAGDDLRRLSDGFSRVYQKAAPSVVHIHSETTPLEASLDGATKSTTRQARSGSGVLFRARDTASGKRYFILTNHHVIDQAARTRVRIGDGREFDARLTGSDPKTDIAVIEVTASALNLLPLADSDHVEIGQWVLAIGNPFGLKHSLSVGIVSGTGRTNVGINAYEDFIQTDAAIGPGNSGGPLINLHGEVIGIISSLFTHDDGTPGAGFAIPSNLALAVADQLIATGAVDRAYLGVFLQSLNSSLARAFEAPNTLGALISQVAPGSPADVAGLRVGDIIVRYQDQPVRDAGSFINDLSLTTPNTEVSLTILRQAKRQTLTATVAARSTFESVTPKSSAESTIVLQGMTLSRIDKDVAAQLQLPDGRYWVGNGLLVTAVKSGSVAARAGIVPDNILMEINRQGVSDFDDLNRLVAASQAQKQMLLLFRQGQTQQFVTFGSD